MHTRARTKGRERRELGFRSNRRSPGKLELNFAKSYVTHVGYLRLSRRNVSFFPLVEIGDNYLPSTRSERTSPLSPPPLLISISFRIFPVSRRYSSSSFFSFSYSSSRSTRKSVKKNYRYPFFFSRVSLEKKIGEKNFSKCFISVIWLYRIGEKRNTDDAISFPLFNPDDEELFINRSKFIQVFFIKLPQTFFHSDGILPSFK